MTDGEPSEKILFPMSVGERLRVAREAAKLDLNDVSTRTRIPLRHLTAIEQSDYSALPSHTYALGFAKSYARAIGLDENLLATDLRAELGRAQPGARDADVYEPADPSRVPPRLLAWTAAVLALIIVIGYGVWRGGFFDGPEVTALSPQPIPSAPVVAKTVAPPAAPAGAGQVVLTATMPVWLRIQDVDKKTLLKKEMVAGETYQVPMDAKDPRILTGRPDALKVTIDGQEVAPIGSAKTTVRDAPISAASLKARVATPTTGSTSAGTSAGTSRTGTSTATPVAASPQNVAR